MESILNTIKKLLGISEIYTAFDVDIITCINSAFTTLNQLGIGSKNGFYITDETATWDSFIGNDPRLNSVKTYLYLKTRMLFDPPSTSFVIDAIEKQIREHEWRLSAQRESDVVMVLPKQLYN